LAPCLTKHHAMKTSWGVKLWRQAFLNSALGGEWSASSRGCFIPEEIAPGTHWIGGWVGPEPVWTRWRREQFPAPGRISTPELWSSSP